MRLATSLTSLLMLAPGSGPAQQSRVIVGANVPISVDDSKRPHFETFLAVDQRNAKHMLVSSMVLRGLRFGTSIYVTFDGGRRWARARMASKDTTLFTGGDGAVYFDRDGTALTTSGNP